MHLTGLLTGRVVRLSSKVTMAARGLPLGCDGLIWHAVGHAMDSHSLPGHAVVLHGTPWGLIWHVPWYYRGLSCMASATACARGMTMARAVAAPWQIATRGIFRGNPVLAMAAHGKPHGLPRQPPPKATKK